MIRKIYNPVRILGFTALFIMIVSFATYAQNGSSQTNQSSNPTASSNQNTSAAQKSSFESYAAQFANDLAQQTGLSADKADKIRAVLVDYYNDITNTRQEFMRDRRDPRSQDANNSRTNNSNTSDNNNTTDNSNSNDNRDVIGGQNGNNNNNAIGGNAGTGSTSDNSLNGTSTTGQGGTGTGVTGTDASSGTNGANQASSNQDLMKEYRKADLKADKKILDVFDNDSQKAKYVQVKRQWWQNVKNKAFSDEDQNSGGIQAR